MFHSTLLCGRSERVSYYNYMTAQHHKNSCASSTLGTQHDSKCGWTNVHTVSVCTLVVKSLVKLAYRNGHLLKGRIQLLLSLFIVPMFGTNHSTTGYVFIQFEQFYLHRFLIADMVPESDSVSVYILNDNEH